jgi:enoyl-CoA hydratase/carnithine racemase
MTDYKYLHLRREDSTLVCTITNPPKNFLNAAIMAELTRMANEIDDSVRALVLTGGVEGIFITHYDVNELVLAATAMRAGAPIGRNRQLHELHKLTLHFRRMPIPVIAAINGTAMGGGCELTLGCDFRYMARGYRIGCPEVRVGILPGGGGTQRIARLVGTARALELMLLGDTLEADEAERVGLIHRAVDPEKLMPEVLTFARELGSRPPAAVARIKRLVHEGVEMPLADALRIEQAAFWELMRTDDADRLMRAYLEGDLPLDQQ